MICLLDCWFFFFAFYILNIYVFYVFLMNYSYFMRIVQFPHFFTVLTSLRIPAAGSFRHLWPLPLRLRPRWGHPRGHPDRQVHRAGACSGPSCPLKNAKDFIVISMQLAFCYRWKKSQYSLVQVLINSWCAKINSSSLPNCKCMQIFYLPGTI